MPSPSEEPTNDLFLRLVSALEQGGQLTDALLDYIEATLFSPQAHRLAAFLRDDDDSQRDSLLDLIFYPEPAFQVLLEPLLMERPLALDAETALSQRLVAQVIQAPIRLPDGTLLAEIALPAFVKSQYIARLNLSWRMDAPLAEALAGSVSPVHLPVVRVRLRNSRLQPVGAQTAFLCRFFERLPDDDPDYLACLDLMLPLVAEAAADADVYRLLVHHKRELFRNLQQARRFEALLRRSNMETLMLQGIRPPHAACDEWLDQMRLIDRICMGVFGRTDPLLAPIEEPIHEIADLGDPAATVSFLWR